MGYPLISVIVPVYKVEPFLDKCVESLIQQSYPCLEILLVDDGSPDGCPAMCDAWAEKDSRIRVVHKENGGVSSARLRGVSEAAGEFIGFVDSDDHIEPQMYGRLMENLLANDADISHCGYQMVYPDGRIRYFHNTGKLVRQDGHQGCADLLAGSFVEPGLVNKLYRRELFDGLEQWMDPSIRINEDMLMNFYLFRQAKACVFEDICPYHYVLRSDSAVRSQVDAHQLTDPLTVRRIIFEETKPIPQWNRIAGQNLVYYLTLEATRSLGNQRLLIMPYRKAARRELRHQLFWILTKSGCPPLRKLMTLWAAVWPASYGWVHRAYSKAVGTDKKYIAE